MKIFSLLICLISSTATLAQTSVYSTTHSQIDDNDKTLSIQIEGQRNGKPVQYSRSFNVAGMGKDQKEAIKNRVLDSLGLGKTPPTPELPNPPLRHDAQEMVTFVCATCTGKSKIMITSNGQHISQESDGAANKLFPIQQLLQPGTYQYTYWQNKVLQMQLPFTVRAGEENVVTVK